MRNRVKQKHRVKSTKKTTKKNQKKVLTFCCEMVLCFCMKARKTIKIEKIVDDINWALTSIAYTKEQREVLIGMLDKWLIENKAYKGFRYLGTNEVMEGYKAGMNAKTTDDTSKIDVTDLFKDTDETRVFFFQ